MSLLQLLQPSVTHLSTTFPLFLPLLPPVLAARFTPYPHPSRPRPSSSISSCTYVFVLAQAQVLECLFERGVAQCVTRGVDGRVDVAQPVADSPHSVGDAGLAEGGDQHHDIIRCPCDDESQQDGKDSLGHLWRIGRKERGGVN